jgi:hypothetical protein
VPTRDAQRVGEEIKLEAKMNAASQTRPLIGWKSTGLDSDLW